MAAKMLNYFTFFLVFIGLVMADCGQPPSAATASSVLGGNGTWPPHGNNSSIGTNATTMALLPTPTSSSATSPETSVPSVNAASVIFQEPGFVLLSLAFGLMTGGMALL